MRAAPPAAPADNAEALNGRAMTRCPTSIEQKPSRRLWIFAGVGALALHVGGAALAIAHLQTDESDDSLGAPGDRDRPRTGVAARRSHRPAAGSGHRRVGGVARARRAEGRGQGNRTAEGHADRRPKRPIGW